MQFISKSIPQVTQYLKAGKVRALAMTGKEPNAAIADVPTMAADDVKTRMVQQGADPAFLDSTQFTQFLQSDGLRWAQAVKKAGVKLD